MHCIYNEEWLEGQTVLILFIAPIPEATFLDNLSMCVCHRRLSSINVPSDLTQETIDPFHKWLPIINYFVSIKISLTNLVFELIIHLMRCIFRVDRSCIRVVSVSVYWTCMISVPPYGYIFPAQPYMSRNDPPLPHCKATSLKIYETEVFKLIIIILEIR